MSELIEEDCSAVLLLTEGRSKVSEISWQQKEVITVSYLHELLSCNTTVFKRLAKQFITYKMNIVLIKVSLIDSYF